MILNGDWERVTETHIKLLSRILAFGRQAEKYVNNP